MDNLRRKGLNLEVISKTYSFCGKRRDTISHLFIHCGFTFAIWSNFLTKCGISWSFPVSMGEWLRFVQWLLLMVVVEVCSFCHSSGYLIRGTRGPLKVQCCV